MFHTISRSLYKLNSSRACTFTLEIYIASSRQSASKVKILFIMQRISINNIQSRTEPELLIKKNNNQNFVLIIYRYQNKPNAFFFFLFLVRFDARWFTNFSDFSLIGARAGVGVGGSVIPPVRQSKFLSEPDYHLHVRKVPPRGQTYGTKMIIIIIMDHYLHTKIAMHFIKFWLFANCQTSFQIVLFAFDVYFWTP